MLWTYLMTNSAVHEPS